MRTRTPLVLIYFLLISADLFSQQETFDLAIENVKVFNSKTKAIEEHRTILINGDTIAAIVSSSGRVKAHKRIDGRNRLIIPGFIDTHTHLRNVYGNLEDAARNGRDRKKLADTYLQYGTTTIVDMGQPEKWMDSSLHWQKNPARGYPNIFISGGAMVTEQLGRTTYMNHVAVKNPEDARAKVREYADRGLQHMKLYWRLRPPELAAALDEGRKRNLAVSGHIDNNFASYSDAIDSGLKNFEHVLALPPAIFVLNDEIKKVQQQYGIGNANSNDLFLAQILFLFMYIRETPQWDMKLEALFDKMAKNNVTLSTAIHIEASISGKSYFFTSLTLNSDSLNLPGYTTYQKQQLATGFDVMMQYLRSAHNKGVKIRIGTDCPSGGKALLSELLLLYEAKFSIPDILQIATLNGAEAMKIDDRYGSIEKGKKADLVLFSKDPFTDYKNFLSEKLIVKSGTVWNE